MSEVSLQHSTDRAALAPSARLTPGGNCTCGLISPDSGRDCVKSLPSSYTGMYSQTARQPRRHCSSRCRSNMAHVRQSRPYSGLGFQVKVVDTISGVASQAVYQPLSSEYPPLAGDSWQETTLGVRYVRVRLHWGGQESAARAGISPDSGRDCVKSLRSSYTGLYPQTLAHLADARKHGDCLVEVRGEPCNVLLCRALQKAYAYTYDPTKVLRGGGVFS